MKMVTVHSFKVWDINKGDYAYPPLKSTAERIERARGVIIPNTAEDVPEFAVDGDGQYDPGRNKGNR
jgi:hypothetical protein